MRKEIRGSSFAHLAKPQSQVVATAPASDLVKWLVPAFGRRGFAVLDQRSVTDGTMLKFKGPRTQITMVVGSQYGVYGSSNMLGSVFYVYVSEVGGKRQIRMIGKPTLDNKEICSDDDAGLDPCEHVEGGVNWPGWSQVSGKEEAEVIRGLFVELANSGVGEVEMPPPPVLAAPAAGASGETANDLLWKVWAAAHTMDTCEQALALLKSDAECSGASCSAPLQISGPYAKACRQEPDARIALHRMRRKWESEAGAQPSVCLQELYRAVEDAKAASGLSPQCAGEGKTDSALRTALRQQAQSPPPAPPKP